MGGDIAAVCLMNRIVRTTGLAASLLAVFVMAGGHWWALQLVAWARMITDDSRQYPLSTAIERTFSGKNPCALCLRIRQAQQQEEQQARKFPGVKPEKLPDLLCEAGRVAVPAAPAASADLVTSLCDGYADFLESPPTPPPRAA
jgi:hypothetical protein